MKDIKELRIGNKLEFLGEEITVEGIDNLEGRSEMYWIKPIGMIPSKMIHFKRINLSEERLLELEFKKINGGIGWDSFRKGDFELVHVPTNKGNIIAYDRGNGKYTYIFYLHQLQNLYFALIKEELI